MAISASNQYLGHVTDLGEKDVVTASEDIMSSKGVMLLPKGASINKKLLSRLQQHSIDKDVDQVIDIQDTLDGSALMEYAQEYLEDNPQYSASLDLLHDRTTPIRGFARLRLNTSTRNKLTVCKKQKPELFEHSVLITYTSLCVADLVQLPQTEKDDLATAAILHDLGMMHLSDDILNHDEVFTKEEEKHIATHPIIIHRILNQFPEYQDSIARITLEHHEHLDGSGYPMAKTSEKLSLASQILAVSECAVSIYSKHSYHYAITVLKSHMGEQFNDQASKALIKILESWNKAATSLEIPKSKEEIEELYAKISACVTSGQKIMDGLKNPFASTPAAQHLTQRLDSIELSLVNAGLDRLRGNTTIKLAAEDDELGMEIGDLIQDATFQIMDGIRIFRRQLHPDSKLPAEFRLWLKDTEDTLKSTFQEDCL